MPRFIDYSIRKWVGIFLLLIVFTPSFASNTNPTLNRDQKWRIAYYEGGPYLDYHKVLYETVRGLMRLGWIEKTDLPYPSGDDGRILWNWLSGHTASRYLEFPKDAFYTSDWKEEQRKKVVPQLMRRLKDKKDIDILLAAGTQAGQDFANDNHSTKTFVLTTSNPIAAGIIKGPSDHSVPHARVTVDPTRHYRQLNIFYQLALFDKLGIIYDNDTNGRSFSGIADVEKVAEEKGFKVVKCHSKDESVSDQAVRDESVLKCLDQLKGKIDALYVTQQGGVNERTVVKIAEWAIENQIRTFSQSGSDEVKLGLLMGTAPSKFTLVGEFEAEGIAQALNGVPMVSLRQKFVEPIFISLNLKTANKIKFNSPIKLMGVVEEIVR